MPPLMVAEHLLSCHLHLCIFPGLYTHTQTQLTQAHACIHTHAQHGDTNTNRVHWLLKHLCFLFAFVSSCQACVCMHMCACFSCVCVCVCVCLAQGRHRDEGNRRGSAEQPSEEAQSVPSLRVIGRHISAVILYRMGKRKGRLVITPGRGSRNLQLDQTQKHAHHFYRVVVCFWTGKRRCMV